LPVRPQFMADSLHSGADSQPQQLMRRPRDAGMRCAAV